MAIKFGKNIAQGLLGNFSEYDLKKATEEYLIVDLVNNLDHLAEDQEMVLTKVKLKAQQMNKRNLNRNLNLYGNVRTKKLLTAAFA